MKKTLLYLIPLIVLLGLSVLYINNKNTKLDNGTYLEDVNVSYQSRDEITNLMVQIYANTTKNKKIRIIYNNDYLTLDNSLFSIDLNSTLPSFYEGSRNKIFVKTDTEGLHDAISSYFSMDLSGIDMYRLVVDIQNDYFSKNVNSFYDLADYIKEDIYKETYKKKDMITITPENAELIYEATGGKIIIEGKSRFSVLDLFRNYQDQITAKDLSLFASALESLVAQTDTCGFIRTNTYESNKKVMPQLRPHMVYVSFASNVDASFYNDSEEDIIINISRPTRDKISLEMFLKDSQEFSKLQVTTKPVRFDAVYKDKEDEYVDKENGIIYYVYKDKVVDGEVQRIHIYDTYYLPVGVKK